MLVAITTTSTSTTIKTSGTSTGELETLVSPKPPFTKVFLSIPGFYIL